MAEGDEQALSGLYDRFSGVVFSLAARILGDEDDAAEVTLDTFTQAWLRAADFDPGRSTVTTWLCVMARSRAIDRMRARRSQRDRVARATQRTGGEPVGMASRAADANDALENTQRRRHIQRAMTALPEPQRRAIELAYFDGLSQSQIASRLGVPLGTIKTRIRSGMRTLKDLLEPLYADAWL